MAQKQIPLALQLYTVRDEAARDFAGTLERVAALGYAGVELAGLGGLAPGELRRILDDLGLRCAGSHIGLPRLESALGAVLDENLILGNPYVVVPAIPEEWRGQEADYVALARRLDTIGAACREQGLTLAYHNHAFEFQRFAGRCALDIIYEETDPALVKGEPDVYWFVYAGADPAAWIASHPNRCPLVHLKDMAPGPERDFAPVGAGIIDFGPILAASEAQGVEWYIVEQDRCARPSFECAALSLQNLRAWGIA